MSRSYFMSSPNVPSLLAALGTLSLAACRPIEFEGDPDGGGHIPALGGSTSVGTDSGGSGGSTPVGSDGGPSTSGPKTLLFKRLPGMGFCVDELDAIELRLVRNADGLMSVEGTYATLTSTGEPCPPTGTIGSNCVVPVPFSSYTLSSTQQAELDQLVEALPSGDCRVSNACDPCVVPTLEMDGRTESTCCGEQKTPGFSTAFDNIQNFLDSLIPRRANFELFRLQRGPGMGYCVDPGQAQDVSFRRDSDGTVSMSGGMVQSALAPGQVCPEGTQPFVQAACVSTIPTTKLSAHQQAKLEQMIAALPTTGHCDPNAGLMCDPCTFTRYDIDSRSESFPCCGTQTLPGFSEAFASLGQYVDSLMPKVAPGNDTIRLGRSPALGFCVDKGQGIDITLQRDATGAFTMSGTYVARANTPAAECPTDTAPVGFHDVCIGTLSPVTLSADETQKLDALAAALPASQCQIDERLSCDPCVVPTLELGSRSEHEECCGTQKTEGFVSAFEAVGSYVDSLIRQRSSF